MPRGRKPLKDPKIQWKVPIDVRLAAEVELILLDPVRRKVEYGKRGEYIEGLIRRDLDERRRKELPCHETIPGNGFENVMFCKLKKGHEGPHGF